MTKPEPWAHWCDGHGLEFWPNKCPDKSKDKHALYTTEQIVKMVEELHTLAMTHHSGIGEVMLKATYLRNLIDVLWEEGIVYDQT